jgi:hypothetical protein
MKHISVDTYLHKPRHPNKAELNMVHAESLNQFSSDDLTCIATVRVGPYSRRNFTQRSPTALNRG